ncbi:MAG: hypothetical protein GF355_03005 [Candidatus Eisenbacteria bacterium]|nr:hypothetical protein [Candidatus Eisenbacteria bacterium]
MARARLGRGIAAGAAAVLVWAAAASTGSAQEERVRELERRIDILAAEIEQLKTAGAAPELDLEGRPGLAPAASKVYGIGHGVSLGGYGEMLYESYAGEREDGTSIDTPSRLDFLRAIIYAGYKFSDRILFNSEMEFEHATSGAGSVSLEFAYVDFLLAEQLGVRAGLLLLPMGFLNELHEPPIFLGATRPETERRIIPSTWRENGAGFYGTAGDFTYRAYVTNSFDGPGGGASGASGFDAGGLRGGRQKGAKALAEDLALTVRADFEGVAGLVVGGSLFAGNTGQGRETAPGKNGRVQEGPAAKRAESGEISAFTMIAEGHADYSFRGLSLRGLASVATVDEADRLNALNGYSGTASVGETLAGGYVQAGYDVLRHVREDQELIPYIRYEWIDTQKEVPAGYAADPANQKHIITAGAAYKPILNVVIKADYQFHRNDAETGVDQFNLVLGYLF